MKSKNRRKFEETEEIVIAVRIHIIIGIVLVVTILNAHIAAITILSVKSSIENSFQDKVDRLETKM